MSRRALFLDRDGVINTDHGYMLTNSGAWGARVNSHLPMHLLRTFAQCGFD